MANPHSDPRRPVSRKRGIPPAPIPLPSFEALETQTETVRLALWQCLRNVLTWAHTPPENRRGLFWSPTEQVAERLAAAAGAVPLLADPFAIFEELQRAPEAADAAAVGAACNLVEGWADRCGLRWTARQYAEAAAYAEPMNPSWANRAGYINRMAGGPESLGRSSAWYQRGYALAIRMLAIESDRSRRKRAKDEALRALTGTGALMKDLGRFDEAQDYYLRASRRAVNTGRHRRAAIALHYAFALAVEREDYTAAVEYAEAALTRYPIHNERLPALAHDFAYLLIRQHHFVPAFRILDGLPERVGGVWAMGMLQGLLVRAAAGAGRSRKHWEAERVALNLAALHDGCAAPIFMNVAAAAYQLGKWDRATEYGARALEYARAKQDPLVESLALDLLDAVRRREPPPSPCALPTHAPLAKFSRRLAARMRQWNGKRGGGR